MKHVCEICGYSTSRISNFKDHQNLKKPCKKKDIKQESDNEEKKDNNSLTYSENITSVKSENVTLHSSNIDNKNNSLKITNTEDKDKIKQLKKSLEICLEITNTEDKDKIKQLKQALELCIKINSPKDESASNKYECNKCNKILSSNRSLKKHYENCKGIKNILQCQICSKVFSHRNAKYRHNKNVKCKPCELPPKQVEIDVTDEIDDNKIEILEKVLKLCAKENRLHKLALKFLSLQKENDEIKNLISTGTLPIKKETLKNAFTPSQKKTISFNQNYKCKICDIILPADFEIDHIISQADGGTNELSNGQALCKPYHEKKTYQENIARKSLKNSLISINDEM